MSGWQPIETAPKDGTEVLATDGLNFGVVRWVSAIGWLVCFGEDGGANIGWTHWMPLPDPP